MGNKDSRVGFDHYRSDILKQPNLELPANLEEDRAFWLRLAERLHELDARAPTARVADDATVGNATVVSPTSAGGSG